MNTALMPGQSRRGPLGFAAKSPFTSVWQAAVLLGCTEKEVYQRIQGGRLPLTFDIACPGGDRSYVRLASTTVLAAMRQLKLPSNLEEFFDMALPESQFSYRAPQLARLWQCDPDHVYHLIGAKELRDIGGVTRYRIPRDSVIEFLTRRRMH